VQCTASKTENGSEVKIIKLFRLRSTHRPLWKLHYRYILGQKVTIGC